MAKVTVSLATGLLFVSTIVAVTLVVPFGRIVLGAAVTLAVTGTPAAKVTLVLAENPLAVAVILALPATAPLVSVASAIPLLSVTTLAVTPPSVVVNATVTPGAALPLVSSTVARIVVVLALATILTDPEVSETLPITTAPGLTVTVPFAVVPLAVVTLRVSITLLVAPPAV